MAPGHREIRVRRRMLGPLFAPRRYRRTRYVIGGPSLPLTRVLHPQTLGESPRTPGHSSVHSLGRLPHARF